MFKFLKKKAGMQWKTHLTVSRHTLHNSLATPAKESTSKNKQYVMAKKTNKMLNNKITTSQRC